jgi:hypothetical protein
MITTLLILLGLIGYASVGAWTWGYARGALEDETGWESPAPLMAGLFWPIILTAIIMKCILVPLQAMGFSLQQKQMIKKKQRIELQTKTRIELETAERELEKAYNELEEEENAAKKPKKRAAVSQVPRK